MARGEKMKTQAPPSPPPPSPTSPPTTRSKTKMKQNTVTPMPPPIVGSRRSSRKRKQSELASPSSSKKQKKESQAPQSPPSSPLTTQSATKRKQETPTKPAAASSSGGSRKWKQSEVASPSSSKKAQMKPMLPPHDAAGSSAAPKARGGCKRKKTQLSEPLRRSKRHKSSVPTPLQQDRTQAKQQLEEASSGLPRLPDELISLILSWLPATSILKFRIVCKSWNAITRDNSFLDLHGMRAASGKFHITYICSTADLAARPFKYQMFFLDNGGSEFNYFLKQIPINIPGLNNNKIHLGCSCHGLTVYSVTDKTSGEDKETDFLATIFVRNILTGQEVQLPGHRQDPLVSLGFDPVNKVFKVVRVVDYTGTRFENSKPSFVEVHTLGDIVWRRLYDYPFPKHENSYPVGVYCKGQLHWEVTETTGVRHVFSFDVRREVFRKREFPRRVGTAQLFEWWDDTLFLGIVDEEEHCMEIWALDNDEENTWSRKCLFKLRGSGISLDAFFQFVGPCGNDELLMEMDRGLVAFNLQTHIVKKITISENGLKRKRTKHCHFMRYIGTLIPPLKIDD